MIVDVWTAFILALEVNSNSVSLLCFSLPSFFSEPPLTTQVFWLFLTSLFCHCTLKHTSAFVFSFYLLQNSNENLIGHHWQTQKVVGNCLIIYINEHGNIYTRKLIKSVTEINDIYYFKSEQISCIFGIWSSSSRAPCVRHSDPVRSVGLLLIGSAPSPIDHHSNAGKQVKSIKICCRPGWTTEKCISNTFCVDTAYVYGALLII